MSEKIIYPFIKTDGFALPCKKGCPNCTHCTDVWWDYSHGIYYTECELDGDAPLCELYENDSTEPITVEEFNKLKEEEDVRIFQVDSLLRQLCKRCIKEDARGRDDRL